MGKRNAHNLDFGGFSLVRTVIWLARIDRFTDTAAILNKLDLSSIMGCPGGMSTFRKVFTSAFRRL